MTYVAGHTKRRRTQTEMAAVRSAITEVLENDHPQIIRQIYYALVVKGVVDKTEVEYDRTVVRLCAEMRWSGELDWDLIVDESRIIHETQTYDSVVDAIEETARFYRNSALRDCSEHIEIWVEKAGLGSIIWEVAGDYDVPVVVTKGMASLSQLYECFRRIRRAHIAGKRTYLYQFGDWDPTGCLIPQKIEESLERFCDQHDQQHAMMRRPIIERIALTKEQIKKYKLPVRPTKRTGNPHAKDFKGDSVELDALPAQVLRDLVADCIERHISPRQLAIVRVAEESERELIAKLGRKLLRRGQP